MSKDLEISFLNEIYGDLLTVRQRDIIAQYYDYDLSLQEISENLGISRQAVLDAVRKGSEQLHEYENKLSILATKKAILSAVEDIENGRQAIAVEKLKNLTN